MKSRFPGDAEASWADRQFASLSVEQAMEMGEIVRVHQIDTGDPAAVTAVMAALAAQSGSDATARRDDLIRALHGQGMSLRRIGGLVGMSHAGVRRVIDRG